VSQLANMLQLSIRRLTITSSLMQCPFPYKMGSIGYWASAYWKIFFICRPSEIKFTVILFPLQLIWIRWSLSIRSENATLTSQQPSDELLKKKWSLPNYIAPLEKLLAAHVKQRTVIAIDSNRQQSTLPSTCVDSWLQLSICRSDTLTVNTGVRTRNAACNERCRTPTVVGQRYIDMLLGLQPSISIRLSLTLKQLDHCQAAFIFIQYSKVPVVLQNKGSCSPIRHSASVRRTRDVFPELFQYSLIWKICVVVKDLVGLNVTQFALDQKRKGDTSPLISWSRRNTEHAC